MYSGGQGRVDQQAASDMKNGKFCRRRESAPCKNRYDIFKHQYEGSGYLPCGHMTHHNTGDKWCIYPMYDFAHPIEDAIEGITHSICTLEFEDHRPLYDWVVKELEYPQPPKQIEFAKLYLTNVVTGKRYIKKLVEEGIVDGWMIHVWCPSQLCAAVDLHRNPSRCS